MQYLPYDILHKYACPVCDPLSTTGAALAGLSGGSALSGGAMALKGLGTAFSATNTLAGGNYAAEAGQLQQQAANYQAQQLQENAPGEIAAAQRQAIAMGQKADLLRSSAVANTAAGGVNAATGSALTNQAEIVNRGQQNSLLDLWQGENRATGLTNEAQGKQFSGAVAALAGQEAKRAATVNALSTIAGGGASWMRMYG
jgi:hypothetical protein